MTTMLLPTENVKGFVVYLITNLVNEMMYVGCTRSFKRRMQGHAAASKIKNYGISKALNDFGLSSFRVCILERCVTEDSMLEAEQFWIEQLSLVKQGYNLTAGGDGVRQLSEQSSANQRAALSRALKGKSKTKEHNAAVSKALIGRKFSEATKEKLRQKAIGRKASEATKLKMSLSRKGKPQHPNTVRALAAHFAKYKEV